MRARFAVPLALLLTLAPAPARAGFHLVNLDGPGLGLNDPTPVAPISGNPGTTVGQQRINVFERAGAIWDRILGSPVQIEFEVFYDSLGCNLSSVVLGAGGPSALESDFVAAPFTGTWYSVAQANRLTGVDLEPDTTDISTEFNASLGTGVCAGQREWYYGYDGKQPPGFVALLPVAMHELGHGLGFLTATDGSNGQYFGGVPSVFDRFLMDDVSHKHWFEMTPTERVASAINTNHLVWDGPQVTLAAPHFLGARPFVSVSGSATSTYPAGEGVIGAPLTVGGISGDIVYANDGVGQPGDGCQPLLNGAAISGHIALMDRATTCAMPAQAQRAQDAGAIAVIFVNNVAGVETQVRGQSATVTIPCAGISQVAGGAIKTALGVGTVHATLALDPSHLAGANDQHQVYMYAPSPYAGGSSVSHFDVSAFPNLTMEPSYNPDLNEGVDLAMHAFYDIGWFPQLTGVPGTDAPMLALTVGPNPARDRGTLRFRLPTAGHVELAIFDLAGRRIVRLANTGFGPGEHAVPWERLDDSGHRVGPGVYLARLKCGGVQRTIHLVLVD
jgi:hypothetical protein